MKTSLTDEQIIQMIKEQDAGEKTAEVCRRYGAVRRQEAACAESWECQAKELLAERMLDNVMLRDVNSTKW